MASQPECSHEQSNILDEPSESSDEPTTPVNCTCGNCHLYTLCTRGCLNPGVGSDVSLLVWSGTGKACQTDEWQLIMRLKASLMQVEAIVREKVSEDQLHARGHHVREAQVRARGGHCAQDGEITVT